VPIAWTRAAVASVVVLVPLVGVVSAASVPVSSSGARCTIVGTPRADVLVGTSHRDVICGRGGDDVIRGMGGDDVIDGGPGADRIDAGTGSDRIDGGTGNDRIVGGTGNDRIDAGTGNDRIDGGTGNDRIVGGTGKDTIDAGAGNDRVDSGSGDDRVVGGTGSDTVTSGTGNDSVDGGSGSDRISTGTGADTVAAGSGDDRVSAGSGNDRVAAGSGNDTVLGGDGVDVINGDTGADVVDGGAQNDVLTGGSGDDTLDGGSGDDTLRGSAGLDDMDGGAGQNECVVDAVDVVIRCHYDDEAPTIRAVVVSPGAVDVSDSDAEVEVRVHVTDDSAVVDVQGYLDAFDNTTALWLRHLELVSGSAADGWWAAKVTVPRWTPSASLHASIDAVDRVGRWSFDSSSRLAVTSRDPDTEGPQLALTTLSPGAVDVRAAARQVTVSVRGTDAKSGIERIDLCLERPGTPTTYDPRPIYAAVACQEAVPRASGTGAAGTWTAALSIPKGAVGATYDVVAYATDRIGNATTWFGPDAYAAYVGSNTCCTDAHQFADGKGRLDVTGQVADTTAAWITAVTASKTTLDTLATSDTVHVRVHAKDAVGAGEGVTSVEAQFSTVASLSSDPQFGRATLHLTTGTPTDGWWEGDVVASQGTPPGAYHLIVLISDRAHGAVYTDPDGPFADGISYLPLEGIPTFTVIDRR